MCTHAEESLYLEMLELPSVIVQLPPLVFNLCLSLPLLLLQRMHVIVTPHMCTKTRNHMFPKSKLLKKAAQGL